MNHSRTKNSLLIMATSCMRQVISMLLTFVSRTVFIYVLGAEYLGLNGLFSNILSLLTLSELGIGTAILFYLYKPLAEKDTERIKALMRFYKLSYRAVGFSILGLGLCLMPFLPSLVNFEQGVPVNLYLVYALYLLNTAFSYLFFAYKQALISANQEAYKIEKVNIAFAFINCLTDIVVLLVFRDYILYLAIKLVLTFAKNLIIAAKVDREYPYLKEKDAKKLRKDEIKALFKDVGAVSLFSLGSSLYNTTDNLIISALLGTALVGYYSNYLLVITQITTVLKLILGSLSAGIGNVVATESKKRQFEIFKQLDFFFYAITVFCTVCLFQLLNSFIKIWLGNVDERYVLSQAVVFFLCMSFYTDNTTQIMNQFREASGHFGTGKSLQLLGGCANIILSIFLGKRYGLAGVAAATILCKGFISVLPFVAGISADVFGKGKWLLVKEYLVHMAVLFGIMGTVWIANRRFHMGNIAFFVIECILTAGIPVILLYFVYRNKPEIKVLQDRTTAAWEKLSVRRTRN